jgi:hypothetical protein
MPYTTINKGSSYFNTLLYTGTGSSLANTGVGFKPDWVWIKGRSGATDHGLYDAVRGVQKQLESNNSNAETTETTGLTAFGTDGFTVGALAQLNTSSATYVAWNWLGANTTVSNTSGTITSTVSANTTAGFSIVSYTGTGANNTVGHGLGVTPSMFIIKERGASGEAWNTYHKSLGAGNYIMLQSTAASAASSTLFQNTAPTSSVFSVGVDAGTNGSTKTYIAYCFAEIKGYSKFGSYTGNGSTDGAFVYTGFKPAFIMIKVTSTADDWNIMDNKRDPENTGSELILYADLNNTEGAAVRGDFLSNGFKCRTTNVSVNQSGATYIYMAFAENPFVSSTFIPTTAR